MTDKTQGDKVIFDCRWSLDKMKFKFYTGDIIEGCEEWYWAFRGSNVELKINEFLEELKEVCFPYRQINQDYCKKCPWYNSSEDRCEIDKLAKKKFGKGILK